MKRLALIAAAVIAFGALATSAGAAGSSEFKLIRVNKGVTFPTQKYVLSLTTSRQLANSDVKVSENGGSVLHQTLVPASQAAEKTFGVVLVLDASYSMNGEPISAALSAARAFAAQRNPKEELGLIVYNRDATPKLQPTSSATEISAALAKVPAVATGTHIFDAIAHAESMLSDANISSGSIVLLSDGQEHGHDPKTFEQVTRAARAANMRIYTIGLQSPTFKPGTLQALAAAGRGEYQQAKTTADLKPLFRQLSQEISSEYLLQYTSQAGPNKPVVVKVQVKGAGTQTTGYRTPQLTVSTTPPPPYKPSIVDRIESSPITMVVLALLVAGAIAFLVIALLQPKRSGLPARMAEFVSIRGLQRDQGEPAAPAGQPVEEQASWWSRFEETLEIAEIKVDPEVIVAGTVVATVLTYLLIWAGTGSPWWALFALGVPYLVREWVVRTLARRRNRFAEQLPDALQVVASALRSGHSLAGALAVVVDSASEPMKSEMQTVVAAEQLGIPMEQSLLVVAHRMDSTDVEQLALVAELQREAGGNAAEVVDRVAETVRERFDLRRLIKTLTMQGRMSRWIVSAIPIGILLILQVENPHYLHPLLASTGGKVVFGLAAALAVAGSFVIKRIVDIEV